MGLGEGSLVSSVYSDDTGFVAAAVLAMAPYNGRVYVGAAEVAAESWGPGTVMPGLVHGGPGRAGSGEELGGVRGLHHFMQRTAVQARVCLAASPRRGGRLRPAALEARDPQLTMRSMPQ